ncbi:MAG: carboxypeptidase M32 [Metallosphaera sp.]
MLQDILQRYKKVWALNYSQSLLAWDIETYMPEDDATLRGEAYAQLSTLVRDLIMNLKEEVNSIREEDLDDLGRGVLRLLKRSIRYYTAVPKEITEELERLTSQGAVVWRESKRRGDFASFKPYLEKVVELERQIAERLGYEGHPYNALVDLYEEGITVKDLDNIFSSLLPGLKRDLDKISSEGYFTSPHPLTKLPYERGVMEDVNREILKLLEMPSTSFRMDVSAHPFTIRISSKDVRITTRYEGIDFRSTIFSVVHESGHAMYELMIDPSYEMTPVATGASTGIHESQSRFWENIVGRSREFTKLIYPMIKSKLNITEDEESLYRYFNLVSPGLIRVDADEVTYNFHVALRYEIEKDLISGKISVSDLPSIWDDFMDKYLGLRPKNVSEGVLQDIHWSQGSFGYFPTYTLGNILAATIAGFISDLPLRIKSKDFKSIRSFLADRICKFGAVYPPKILLTKAFGEVYDPKRLLDYIEKKYLTF